MTIKFKVEDVHDALAEWFKANRPKQYKKVAGKDALLFFEVKGGKVLGAGFEVDQ